MQRRASESVDSTAPTIKQVATLAGVSTATVSRILAGIAGPRSKAVERVLKATQELRYEPNRAARALRVRRRQIVAVLLPDLHDSCQVDVLSGISEALTSEGFGILIGDSNFSQERERKWMDAWRAEDVAGLILVSPIETATDYINTIRWRVPLVTVDAPPSSSDGDVVNSRFREGARDAVSYLVGLGFRDVGLINGPDGSHLSGECLSGYLQALSELGGYARPDLVVSSEGGQDGGHAAMSRLLDLSNPPRAVVITSHLMALGALRLAHDRGVRIPEELAVLSFDDVPWAGVHTPPLTTVAHANAEKGRIAGRFLLDRLRDPGRAMQQAWLECQLIVRASCGAGQTSAPSSTLELDIATAD